MIDSNIFITGLFRSGTTLLSRGISVNPEVHICYQPFFPLFKAVLRKFWLQNGGLRPMGDPLLSSAEYKHKFFNTLWGMQFSKVELVELKQEMLEYCNEDQKEKDSYIPELITELSGNNFEELFNCAFSSLSGHLRETGKRFIGTKEVWSEEFIPAFVIKGVKCIHIIRDPRSIIASRNYGKYLSDSCGGQKYPILFIARAWRRSFNIREELTGNNNYLSVIFEDLLLDPEVEFRRICDFIGAEYSTAMTDFSQYRGRDGKSWRGNVSSEKFKNISVDRVDRWKQVLSEDEVFLCEFLCAEEMNKAGYAIETESGNINRFAAMMEDPNASGSWLADFDHTLSDAEKEIEISRKEK